MGCTFPWIADLLLAAWLGMTTAWADTADGGFSDPKEIENRLNAARAELAALPPPSIPPI
jgi:hypothetical protein